MNSLQAMAWAGSKQLRMYSHGFAKGSIYQFQFLERFKCLYTVYTGHPVWPMKLIKFF